VSHVRFTIASELRDAILVGQAVHAVCTELQLDPEVANEIRLCTVEGLTNAIRHSYRSLPGGEVNVLLSVSPDSVTVEISDAGAPMTADNLAVLLHGPKEFDFDRRSSEPLPEGGMGLRIIRATMDEIAYTSASGVNRLHMVKYR
jgi:serine/threonine-protein kinase RsbW